MQYKRSFAWYTILEGKCTVQILKKRKKKEEKEKK